MILILVVWALYAIKWLVKLIGFSSEDHQLWDPNGDLWKTVLASICLDILLAGSEIFHKARLLYKQHNRTNVQEEPSTTGIPLNPIPQYPVQAQTYAVA